MAFFMFSVGRERCREGSGTLHVRGVFLLAGVWRAQA